MEVVEATVAATAVAVKGGARAAQMEVAVRSVGRAAEES